MGAPSEEKALTVVIDDGGCGSPELEDGGGDDLGLSLLSVFVERGEELGGFGALKKEVRVPCALGFLEDEVARSAALRFSGVAIVAIEYTRMMNW